MRMTKCAIKLSLEIICNLTNNNKDSLLINVGKNVAIEEFVLA